MLREICCFNSGKGKIMTLEEFYALPVITCGWRILPSGKYIKIGENVSLPIETDVEAVGNYTIIGDNCVIGRNVTFGLDLFVADAVTIGDNVVLGDQVIIGRKVMIGDNVVLGWFCRIGSWSSITSNTKIHSNTQLPLGCNNPDYHHPVCTCNFCLTNRDKSGIVEE